MNGIIPFDKPAGISSARAVAQVKRLLPQGTKIGHAGTLDPFATGVLLLLVGPATRQCEQLMNQPKQYEATIKFGSTTATDDPESPETPVLGAMPITLAAIEQELTRFIGEIPQRPPTFSAIKIGGRRAYDLARKGRPVEMKSRIVRVHAIEIIDYNWPLLALRIDCGRGTYIRSIARDLGQTLGVGGHLAALRRTQSGSFGIEACTTLQTLIQEGIPAHLHSL